MAAKKLSWSAFAKALIQYGPFLLMMTPLAPIAPAVIQAILEAEQIKGATGPEKLAHVMAIITTAAEALNLQAGHEVVDMAKLQQTGAAIISAIIAIVNLVTKKP